MKRTLTALPPQPEVTDPIEVLDTLDLAVRQLETLPDSQRAILWGMYFTGYKRDEIKNALNLLAGREPSATPTISR